MKKVFCTTLFSLLFIVVSFAQITKSDVLQLLKDMGSSMDKIESFYVGNVKVFYKDGTSNTQYYKYEKSHATEAYTFALTDSGLLIKGTGGIVLIPYSSVIKIYIQPKYIGVDLKD